jgi:hypothetical protein
MLRKIIIRFALKQLVKLIESDKYQGECSDLGINEIRSDFDEHVISINKSVIIPVKKDEKIYESVLTVNKESV